MICDAPLQHPDALDLGQVVQLLCRRPSRVGKICPAERLDRASIRTANTATLDALLLAERPGTRYAHRGALAAGCRQSFACAGLPAGLRPRIGGREAAPLCLCMSQSEPWARRGPERPPWLRRVVAMCTLVNPVLQRSVISSWRLHMQRGGRKPRMISEAAIVRTTIPLPISCPGIPV